MFYVTIKTITMKIEVSLCGIFSDIANQPAVVVDNVKDVEDVINQLKMKYTEFSKYKSIRIVNKKITNRNESLHEGDELTIMPLFIGG